MRSSAARLVLSLAFATGMVACFSTPTDPNAGRALELPPSPDSGAPDGDAAGDDGAIDAAAADSAPDSAAPLDSGGGG